MKNEEFRMKHCAFRIAVLLLLGCAAQLSAASFTTKRLQAIAQHARLSGLDTLSAGTCESYTYRSHPLTIRVNSYGEIEHIGLRLFSDELRAFQPSPIYDFLERYLLDRLSAPAGSEQAIRMGWDRVTFVKGNAQTALSLDGTEAFYTKSREMKYYDVVWNRNGKDVLEMAFDMDWQLLSGCDAIELEQNYVRDLPRVVVDLTPDIVVPDSVEGKEYVYGGRTYIIDAVRNDLFFTRRYTGKQSQWRLLVDTKSPSHSVSNMMLSRQACGNLRLKLAIDRYGYTTDTLTVNYAQLLQKNIDEGCEPYYGFKYKKDGNYHGTVFFVNKNGGYVTMLRVVVPEAAIYDPDHAEVRGRLWTYIPMYNVSESYFKPNEYKRLRDER